MRHYLLREPGNHDIDSYIKDGGYKALEKALAMSPKELISQVEASGLRGRGGAGFPTFVKWNFVASNPEEPKYLICNADEGEPGTFKDKYLLQDNPHLFIEGMIIAAHAVGAAQGYIYLRGEYPQAHGIIKQALKDAYGRGMLGDNILGKGLNLDLFLHEGAGAYICGEESALLESLEGKRGMPRMRPPYMVNKGFMKKPTASNNVETFANIPVLLNITAQAYKAIGTPESPGPKLFAVSGHVQQAKVLELPMGVTLREIIYEHCGGIKDGKKIKGIIPGGVSTPVLPPSMLDHPMDFLKHPEHGNLLGSGAIIVMDEDTCMVKTAHRIAEFFKHESCGKCTPCREGTAWLTQTLARVEQGNGTERDIPLLLDVADNIGGKCFCALGDGAALSVKSFINTYRAEFEAHISEGKCVILPPKEGA
jgi:NADH-quinone oxidoreductase subunit F